MSDLSDQTLKEVQEKLATAMTQANEEKAVLYEQSQAQIRKRKIN
jgi:hypothetical protein